MIVLSLVFALACGEKKPPEPAAAEPVVEPAPAPEPEPEPEPEPVIEEPAPAPDNADFSATVKFGDGQTFSGHVRRVERSSDWFAEEGWEDSGYKVKLELEGNGTLQDSDWTDIKMMSIKAGSVPGDVDCTYSSEYTPWMYTCELRTPTVATTTDGKKWKVNTRHKWKFIYDDGTEVEFWLAKHPARMQDTETVTLDTVNPENYDIYTQLQDDLRAERSTLVTSITIQ